MRMASLAVMALIGLSGCGGGSSTPGRGGVQSPFEASLQGSWEICQSYGTTSNRNVAALSGTRLTVVVASYANGTCSGAATGSTTATGAITVGATVTTAFGNSTVSAHKVDINYDGTAGIPPYYDLWYIDAASPNHLNIGFNTVILDGSSDAKRPVNIYPLYYRTRQ